MESKPSLKGRTVYIPQMSFESASCMAAAFQSIGVDARPSPDGDGKTLELARKYLSGDECLPEAVTLGNFLKITERDDYDPEKIAFMMPTANGPCRFGHYLPLARKIFENRGDPVMFISPSSKNGYEEIGDKASGLMRTGWRAVIVSDILRKMLFKTRPLEKHTGDTDKVFATCLEMVCGALAKQDISHRERIKLIKSALKNTHQLFNTIAIDADRPVVIIGIVGEIFCRLNNFSNDELIRVIEKHGGMAWMSDVAEWVWYTNDEELLNLRRQGKRWSLKMAGSKLRHAVMHHDEQNMLQFFNKNFTNMIEPTHIQEILDLATPYLPREGSNGEMVLSVGKSLWYKKHGAAGIIDISPFTCMNGIITEAIYPRVSRENDNIPMRVIYFDGLNTNVDADIEIFMEMAKYYHQHHVKK